MKASQEPNPATPAGARRRARSGIVVSRFQGTVVVSIHGDLDGPRADDLGYLLTDLIDGQGNRSLIVDLRDATALDPARLSVFTAAEAQARRRGAILRLKYAPPALDAALRGHGLDPSRDVAD